MMIMIILLGGASGAMVDAGINVGEEPKEHGLKKQTDATAEKDRMRRQGGRRPPQRQKKM